MSQQTSSRHLSASGTPTHARMELPDAVAARVLHVLSEDRERPARIEFSGYRSSAEHKQRLAMMPAHLRIPRSEWARHPKYAGRFQMPNFHHEFRQELQAVIALLWNVWSDTMVQGDTVEEKTSDSTLSDAVMKRIKCAPGSQLKHAMTWWKAYKARLTKHIGIEENWIFPSIRAHYPDLDLSFLFDDHRALELEEEQVGSALRKCAAASANDTKTLMAALEAVVKYDEHFMDHLGEEEEFVVPLCLSTRHCLLHGPKP